MSAPSGRTRDADAIAEWKSSVSSIVTACAVRHRGCTAGERVLIHMQPASTTRQARPVSIAIGAQASLEGDLAVPVSPRGLVIFAHPDATERLTAGTRLLADALDQRDIATVVVDLLTEPEE